MGQPQPRRQLRPVHQLLVDVGHAHHRPRAVQLRQGPRKAPGGQHDRHRELRREREPPDRLSNSLQPNETRSTSSPFAHLPALLPLAGGGLHHRPKRCLPWPPLAVSLETDAPPALELPEMRSRDTPLSFHSARTPPTPPKTARSARTDAPPAHPKRRIVPVSHSQSAQRLSRPCPWSPPAGGYSTAHRCTSADDPAHPCQTPGDPATASSRPRKPGVATVQPFRVRCSSPWHSCSPHECPMPPVAVPPAASHLSAEGLVVTTTDTRRN